MRPEAWDRTKGFLTTDPTAANTPKVAVLDSGADCDTLELQGKCLEQTNLVGLNPGFFELDACPPEKPACDNFGHGTFVASELAANTDNGEGIAGAGWNTSFGVFKVCYLETSYRRRGEHLPQSAFARSRPRRRPSRSPQATSSMPRAT